jgi:hypothetical protein
MEHRMSLESRFLQLNAPEHFSPHLGVPLRWRCLPSRPELVAYFDPAASTGFALRLFADHLTGGEMDVAFHLDGRIARMMVERDVILDEAVQERMLSDLFPVRETT